MNENKKQIPANINLVRGTLLGEGCPAEVVADLDEYFKQHSDATVGQLNHCLDKIAAKFGYPDYRTFKRSGFRNVRRDEILVSAIYSPA